MRAGAGAVGSSYPTSSEYARPLLCDDEISRV
jgi:hypothetical protein